MIVDLAAERGGNCELSQADQRVVEHGIVILGPSNLPAEIPNHASQMFSNNITKFLLNLVKDGEVEMNLEDEIIRDTLIAHDGELINSRMRDSLGMEPLPEPQAAEEDAPEEAASEPETADAEMSPEAEASEPEDETSPEAEASEEHMEVETEEQQESSASDSDADDSKSP